MGMTIDEKNKFIEESKEHFKEWHDMNYIPKADYENRLKADMVAMLEELKEQLREMHEDFFETEHFDEAYGVSNSMDIIQQKINALKGEGKK
jgi:DNA-binding LytR/AlgR family response regulator